jgi:predicted transposase YbfD/YdcC
LIPRREAVVRRAPLVIMVFAKTTVVENRTAPADVIITDRGRAAAATPDMSCPTTVTDGDRRSLFVALEAAVRDPRDPRARRYPLVSILAAAVCAVIAGACTFAAVCDWVRFQDRTVWPRLGFTGRVPAETTVWRLLIRIDAEVLSQVLARWLRGRARPVLARRPMVAPRRRWEGRAGARLGDERQVHLLSAYDTSTGIVLAQVQITAKSNEIPSFVPLLRLVKAVLGSLEGVLVVADALHAQIGHADLLAADGAHLMVTIKANQRTLHDRVRDLPWSKVPIGAQTRESGHGRKETRAVKALTVNTPGGLGFPHAQQAVRFTRTRTIKGKTGRETAYLTTSLPAGQARPADLGTWARAEWHIENRLHYVRDVTLREDAHQARTGNGPAVFATLGNTSIGYHRVNGATNIAEAPREGSHRPPRPHHRRKTDRDQGQNQ